MPLTVRCVFYFQSRVRQYYSSTRNNTASTQELVVSNTLTHAFPQTANRTRVTAKCIHVFFFFFISKKKTCCNIFIGFTFTHMRASFNLDVWKYRITLNYYCVSTTSTLYSLFVFNEITKNEINYVYRTNNKFVLNSLD